MSLLGMRCIDGLAWDAVLSCRPFQSSYRNYWTQPVYTLASDHDLPKLAA